MGLACALLTPACFTPSGKDPTTTTGASSTTGTGDTTGPELTTTVTPTTTRDPGTGPDPTTATTDGPATTTGASHSDPTLTTTHTSTAPIDTDTDTDSSGSTDPMTGSTTIAPAGCGDGQLGGGEQCDDSNLDNGDGCSAQCKFEFRYTFVTKQTWFGEDIGGLGGADARCANEAAVADMLNGRTFRAWLSDSSTSAKLHVIGVSLPVRRTDNVLVANGNADLATGVLLAPIDRDAKGLQVAPAAPCGTPATAVWTGTLVDGNAAEVCNDWQIGGTTGRHGNLSSMDGSWTDCQIGNCAALDAHLYCIQVDA